jgi:hypothetical protein
VLIAEEITSRFFNVVHLLSQAIPIIGIQVSTVKIGNAFGLHFKKVIHSLADPEDLEASRQSFAGKYWIGSTNTTEPPNIQSVQSHSS